MKISEEEVRHVAKLSKLSFTDQETRAFAQSLTKIVDMVEMLNEVDTEGVPVTTTMADRKNVMRDDVVQAGRSREDLFKNVPDSKDYLIKVPAIFEEGGEA